MKRYFTFKDEKSSKFWSVDINGNNLTVAFGKTGSPGSINKKSFATPEDASNEAEKLIREKTKKGYVESEDKTAGEFTTDTFWGLIDRAKAKTSDVSERPELLTEMMLQHSEADIRAFYGIFKQLMAMSYRTEVWAAAYLINGGSSGDGFEYFRCWLIAQGKDIFFKTLENPDFLARMIREEDLYEAELEEMLYVAVHAWEAKTGNDMDEFYKLVEENDVDYPEIGTEWVEDEDELQKRLPKLWAKCQ